MKTKNLRTMTVTPASGKDFRDTQVLDGMASRSSVHNGKNETKQYTTRGGAGKGAMGGKNTNS